MATQTSKPKNTKKEEEVEEVLTDVQETEGTPKPKGRFGVSTETKSKNLTPFQPTEEHPITLGTLVNVKTDVRKIKKTEEEVTVLVFEFKDVEKVRTHFHTEWRVDEGDKDEQVKMDGMNARIKHIYEEYQAFPTEGIGMNAESFDQFFEQVAEAFNTNGKDGTPIYKDIRVWIKVTYNLKSASKAQLGFPLSPNFIERYKEGKKPTLYVNKKYETLKQPEGASARSPLPTELGNQAALESDFPDFPKS